MAKALFCPLIHVLDQTCELKAVMVMTSSFEAGRAAVSEDQRTPPLERPQFKTACGRWSFASLTIVL
jgi:hypothetical protein